MAMKRKHPDPNELRPGVPRIPKAEDIPPGYDPKNPWASDMLDRSDHAEILTRYIEGINQPYVLAINAGWGQGKSLFLRMWRDELVNRQRRHCILFNAWKSDFGDDPLVALMGAVSDYVVSLESDGKDELEASVKGLWCKAWACAKSPKQLLNTMNHKRLWRKAWAYVKTAPKHFVKVIIHFAKKWGIDLLGWSEDAKSSDADAPSDKTANCIADALANTASDMYDVYLLQKKSVQGFNSKLKAVAKSLSVNGFPLVIMVDELDRCRPDYAVLLLERIKHLFSVHSVVFILALEAEQLRRTIRALYGLDLKIGARNYLRRFIDREYTLPKPSHEQFADYLCAQYDLVELSDPARNEIGIEIHTLFGELSKVFKLHLRDMAQLIAQTAAVVRSYNANWVEANLVLTLLVIRFQTPKTYMMICDRKLDWRSVRDSLIKEDKVSIQNIDIHMSRFLESIFNYIGMVQSSFSTWHKNIMKDSVPPAQEKAAKELKIFVNRIIPILKVSLSNADHYLSAVEFASRFDLTVAKEVEEIAEIKQLDNLTT